MTEIDFAAPDEPCAFCGKTPESGAWNVPCPSAPRGLHDSVRQLVNANTEQAATLGRYLSRAAFELDRVAGAIDALPPRTRRKVLRANRCLDPDLIRNEAERARDVLHTRSLLDV